MAKDKKSFLMYADYIDVFEGLNDKEAGRLIKHILRYVNDLNPETKDRIVALTFEPIKKQMKRDLRKYETVVVAKSEAGKLGNLKRWNPELYKQVIDRKISLSDALRQNESQKVANIAVTDNDTVNVNDTVINNNNGAKENLQAEAGKENTASKKDETGLPGSKTQPFQPETGNGEYWRKAINEGTKIAFTKTVRAKFPYATDQETNQSMLHYPAWFDLKFPDGGNKKNFTTHFQYYVESMKALPIVSLQKQKPYAGGK